VLDEYAVFEDRDLDAAELRAHHHDTIDALTAGEELALGDDWTAAPCITAVTTSLLLGL
jgi:hypothetical protein